MAVLCLLGCLVSAFCIYIFCTDLAKERLENWFRAGMIVMFVWAIVLFLLSAWYFAKMDALLRF